MSWRFNAVCDAAKVFSALTERQVYTLLLAHLSSRLSANLAQSTYTGASCWEYIPIRKSRLSSA